MEQKRWIFQDIKDLMDDVLYKKPFSLNENWEAFTKAVREQIAPEIYAQYHLWLCDIEVDVPRIVIAVQGVYPELRESAIMEWLEKHKEPHHSFMYY